jgi:hypothetical protein
MTLSAASRWQPEREAVEHPTSKAHVPPQTLRYALQGGITQIIGSSSLSVVLIFAQRTDAARANRQIRFSASITESDEEPHYRA